MQDAATRALPAFQENTGEKLFHASPSDSAASQPQFCFTNPFCAAMPLGYMRFYGTYIHPYAAKIGVHVL